MKDGERSRRSPIAAAGLPLLMILPLGSLVGEEKAVPFRISVRREDDGAETRLERGVATIAIRSPFGIGKATVEHTGDRWPDETKIRLYLKGLEQLRATSGDLRLSVSADSTGESPRSVAIHPDGEEAPALPGDPLRLEVRLLDEQGRETKPLPPDGSFEVVLPKALFEKNPKTIELEWIDFYRG